MNFSRLNWVIICIGLFTVSTNSLNAQQPHTKPAFQNHTSQNYDSLYNILKEKARSSKQDSLYIQHSLEQIQKTKIL